MGRRNNFYITRKNTPSLKQRKTVFLLAAMILLLNLLFMAIVHPDIRQDLLYPAVLTILFIILICIDNRKSHLTVGYVITLSILAFLASAVIIIRYSPYWYFFIWIIEVIVYCIIVFLLLKK